MYRECQRFVAALWTRRMIVHVETWYLMITDIHKLSDLINEAFLIKLILLARRGSQSPLGDQTLILTNWSLLNNQRFVRAVAALRGRRGTKQAQDKFLLESDDLTNEGFFEFHLWVWNFLSLLSSQTRTSSWYFINCASRTLNIDENAIRIAETTRNRLVSWVYFITVSL